MSGWRVIAAALLFMLAAYLCVLRAAQTPRVAQALREAVAAEGVLVWTEAP